MIEFKVTGIRVDELGFEVELTEYYGPFLNDGTQQFFRCEQAKDKPYTLKLRFGRTDPMYEKVTTLKLGDLYKVPMGIELLP